MLWSNVAELDGDGLSVFRYRHRPPSSSADLPDIVVAQLTLFFLEDFIYKNSECVVSKAFWGAPAAPKS